MKKKSLVKKALLPAIVAVMCSLLALTSVSYAWFTMGNEASVGAIDVNVQAAEGLQISATGAEQSWKSILPVSELEALTSTNQFVGEEEEILLYLKKECLSIGEKGCVFCTFFASLESAWRRSDEKQSPE